MNSKFKWIPPTSWEADERAVSIKLVVASAITWVALLIAEPATWDMLRSSVVSPESLGFLCRCFMMASEIYRNGVVSNYYCSIEILLCTYCSNQIRTAGITECVWDEDLEGLGCWTSRGNHHILYNKNERVIKILLEFWRQSARATTKCKANNESKSHNRFLSYDYRLSVQLKIHSCGD